MKCNILSLKSLLVFLFNLFSPFGFFIIMLAGWLISWRFLDINNKLWEWLIFFSTLECMIFIARLVYFCTLKIGIKNQGSFKGVVNIEGSGRTIITLTSKPPKLFQIPIEVRLGYTFDGNEFLSENTAILIPNFPEEFIYVSNSIADTLITDKIQYKIWYKIDIGFYSEWSCLEKNSGKPDWTK